MNKLFLMLIFTLITGYASAQTAPKIRVYQSLFSTKYEIGDKTSTKNDVSIMIKNKDVDAYEKWLSANRADRNGWIWLGIGVAGQIMGALSEDPGVSLIGYGVSLTGYTTSLVSFLSANKRREKSIDMYNAKFNY